MHAGTNDFKKTELRNFIAWDLQQFNRSWIIIFLQQANCGLCNQKLNWHTLALDSVFSSANILLIISRAVSRCSLALTKSPSNLYELLTLLCIWGNLYNNIPQVMSVNKLEHWAMHGTTNCKVFCLWNSISNMLLSMEHRNKLHILRETEFKENIRRLIN